MVTTGLEDCSDTATRRTSTCEWLEALLGCTTLVTEGKGPGLLVLGINTRARKGLSDLTAEMEENQLWVGGAMAMLILMLCCAVLMAMVAYRAEKLGGEGYV